jgi:hypothetical protein
MASKIGVARTCLHNRVAWDKRGELHKPRSSMRRYAARLFSAVSSNLSYTILVPVVGLLASHSSLGLSQATPVAERRLSGGVFATANEVNTQLPYFADNAFGFDAGAFVQLTPLFGLEARIGSAPIGDRFQQEPATAGIRVAKPRTKERQALQFLYLGGGFSRSQYSKADFRPSVSLTMPCWQASSGTDIALGKVTWRLYEATWTETYTPRWNLRSIGMSSGLVYTIGH